MSETFRTRLEAAEDELLSLTRRLYAQEAFLKELNGITRLKPFRIWNDIVWMLLLDSRDMLVIHLASWARALYGQGGLFSQIQAHHLRDFPSRRRKDGGVDDWHRRDLDQKHREVFETVFPNCSGHFPSCKDVCELRDRFALEMRPVVDDRSNHRAHPYETKGGRGTSKMLDHAELRDKVNYATRTLNLLRVLSLDSSMHHGDMNDVSSSDVAEELVDALLLGTSWRQRFVRGETDRKTYYDELHRRHDAIVREPRSPFNDAIED